MTKEEFLSVENLFKEHEDPSKVEKMTSYMKGRFQYLGITAPVRKELLRNIFSGYSWSHENIINFARFAWNSEYRELHYAGLDILMKQVKKLSSDDISFLESLVIKHAWWDTVDGLAVHPIGKTLLLDHVAKKEWVLKWADSDDMWLRRTAILHQLKYKDEVDVDLMEHTLLKANGTKEFFLNKAIGWMLREYSRTNPVFVQGFCAANELSSLSRREALRLI